MVYILIRSRTTFTWAIRSVNSAVNQNSDAYKIIFIDDASDYTRDQKNTIKMLLKNHVTQFNQQQNFSLKNTYTAVHQYTKNNDIIIVLDGDDYLLDANFVHRIYNLYSKNQIYVSYGECKVIFPFPTLKSLLPAKWIFKDHNTRYSKITEDKNAYRQDPVFRPLHPRTFSAALFKKIKVKDFKDASGKWFTTCEDQAMMFPMLEMAGGKYYVDKHISYAYRFYHDQSDLIKNPQQLKKDERYIRAMTPYPKLYA